jgi:hypothetical protein
MDPADKREAVIALERRILRRLCCGEPWDQASSGPLSDLAGYKWLREEHQIVWEALLRFPPGSTLLRESLPTEAAWMGFPDVEWRDYFSGWPVTLKAGERFSAEDAETTGEATGLAALVRKLKDLIEK